MAPEQLEGKQTDSRTDIFAFGSVVYEMVTGRKAFEGQSHASVIAAILANEPTLISSMQPMASPALDRAVKKCLAKDPDERWQTTRDLRDELRWIADGSSQVPRAVRRQRWTVLPWAIVAILLAGLLTLTVAHFRERPTEGSRVVFAVPRPSALLPLGAAPELSPDGTRLVFPGPSPDGRILLWIRALDSLTAHAVEGTDNEGSPGAFWSPDGESIGFFADGKLKTIDVSGGPAHAIADAPDGYGATWSREGIIVFSPREGPLFRVSASGGPATPYASWTDRARKSSTAGLTFFPMGATSCTSLQALLVRAVACISGR